ncbi:uncharacterized protein LOC142973088 isoform X2 [Anticarsia gemmatalis]|uniref:uncharacterized protein LOC142973088 isoform X2 n=1 Tax=Anticarsia gemmatalis TaxID=129554 RepID=UPI003F76EF71
MFYWVLVIGLLKLGASAEQPSVPIQPSYVRKEVPLPNEINSYAPPKQVRFPDNFFHNVNIPYSVKRSMFRGIQYAPLQGVYKYLVGPSKSTSTVDPNSMTTTTSPQKLISDQVHLEPHTQTDQELQGQTGSCFSPGHNVEVLSSVSRSPGHNAVYRSYSSSGLGNKLYKSSGLGQVEKFHHDSILKSINYLKPHGARQINEIFSTVATPPSVAKPVQITRPKVDSNVHQILNPNFLDKNGIISTKPKRQQFSPYSKFHRLHLNIARVYSPGEVQQKPQVLANTYSVNLETEGAAHIKAPAYISPLFHALPDRKTLLLPILRND